MDADQAHRPEDLVRILDALDGGAELTLGNRYCEGAEIDPQWTALRARGSRVAT